MRLDLTGHGFKSIENPGRVIPDCIYLSKRQTLNTNRAICVIQLNTLPSDINSYLKGVRNKVAFKVGFFPIFWGLGLQMVLVSPGSTRLKTAASALVAQVDNQWAIIQSVFLVDPASSEFIEARTWGQVITSRFQDEISRQLASSFHNISN